MSESRRHEDDADLPLVTAYDYSQSTSPYVVRESGVPKALHGKIDAIKIAYGSLYVVSRGRSYKTNADVETLKERVAAGDDVTVETTVEGMKGTLRVDVNALLDGDRDD